MIIINNYLLVIGDWIQFRMSNPYMNYNKENTKIKIIIISDKKCGEIF